MFCDDNGKLLLKSGQDLTLIIYVFCFPFLPLLNCKILKFYCMVNQSKLMICNKNMDLGFFKLNNSVIYKCLSTLVIYFPKARSINQTFCYLITSFNTMNVLFTLSFLLTLNASISWENGSILKYHGWVPYKLLNALWIIKSNKAFIEFPGSILSLKNATM